MRCSTVCAMFFLALACSSDFGQVAEAATIGSSPATPANTGRVPPQSHKKPLQVVVGHTGAQLEEKMFLKKAGGAGGLDLAVADKWTQRNSELDDIIYPSPAEYEALREARWKKGLKNDDITQDQLPDGDYTRGEVSKKAYLKLCAERFDQVDVDGSEKLDFDEFKLLSMPRDIVEYQSARDEKTLLLAEIVDIYETSAAQRSFFQTPIFAVVMIILSMWTGMKITTAVQNHKVALAAGPVSDEDTAAVLSTVRRWVLAPIISGVYTAYTVISTLHRRMSPDHAYNIRYPTDKPNIITFTMATLINIMTLFVAEPFWTRTNGPWINALATENLYMFSALANAPVFTSTFALLYMVAVYYTTIDGQAPNPDFTIIATTRLIWFHIMIWVCFSWIIHATNQDFDGIDTFEDAAYLSGIIHTTVGYGDASVSTQRARRISMCLAVLVYTINSASAYAFFSGGQSQQTDKEGNVLVPSPHAVPRYIFCFFFTIFNVFLYCGMIPGLFSETSKTRAYMNVLAYLGSLGMFLTHLNKILVKDIRHSDDMKLTSIMLLPLTINMLGLTHAEYVLGWQARNFPIVTLALLILIPIYIYRQIISQMKHVSHEENDGYIMMLIANNIIHQGFAMLYYTKASHFGQQSCPYASHAEYAAALGHDTAQVEIRTFNTSNDTPNVTHEVVDDVLPAWFGQTIPEDTVRCNVNLTCAIDDNDDCLNTIYNFETALYFSSITHTSVGFGDINGLGDAVAQVLTVSHAFLVFLLNVGGYVGVMPGMADDHLQGLRAETEKLLETESDISNKKTAALYHRIVTLAETIVLPYEMGKAYTASKVRKYEEAKVAKRASYKEHAFDIDVDEEFENIRAGNSPDTSGSSDGGQ